MAGHRVALKFKLGGQAIFSDSIIFTNENKLVLLAVKWGGISCRRSACSFRRTVCDRAGKDSMPRCAV